MPTEKAEAKKEWRIINHGRTPITVEIGGLVAGDYETHGNRKKKGLVRSDEGPGIFSIPGAPTDDHFAVLEPFPHLDVTDAEYQALRKLPAFCAPRATPHGHRRWAEDMPAPSKSGYFDEGGPLEVRHI